MLKDVRSRWRPLRRRNDTARRAHHGGQRYRAYQVHHLSCLRGALARQQRACASCTKLCLRTSGPRASPPAYNHGSGAHHGDPRDGPCVIRTVQVSQWSSRGSFECWRPTLCAKAQVVMQPCFGRLSQAGSWSAEAIFCVGSSTARAVRPWLFLNIRQSP